MVAQVRQLQDGVSVSPGRILTAVVEGEWVALVGRVTIQVTVNTAGGEGMTVTIVLLQDAELRVRQDLIGLSEDHLVTSQLFDS